MLKSRMLASGILLLALSCAIPSGMALRESQSFAAGLQNAAQDTSETVEVHLDGLEYAMELTESVSFTVSANLNSATDATVVSLPKSSVPNSDEGSASISREDPVIMRSFEEAAAQMQEAEKQLSTQKENGYADGFVFDINRTIFPVTPEEVEMLKYVVEAEAGGGDIEAKRIVTFSITNRVLSDSFPDTLYKVLHSRNQFSTIQNYYSKAKTPSASTCRAVEEVLMGACVDNSRNCMYFYCTNYPVEQRIIDWFENDLVYLYTIGCDRFFTDPV